MGSPVRADSSQLLTPSRTAPSTGTRSPGSTTMPSPTCAMPHSDERTRPWHVQTLPTEGSLLLLLLHQHRAMAVGKHEHEMPPPAQPRQGLRSSPGGCAPPAAPRPAAAPASAQCNLSKVQGWAQHDAVEMSSGTFLLSTCTRMPFLS